MDRPIRLEAVAIADLLGISLEELAHGREDAVAPSQRIERALAVIAEASRTSFGRWRTCWQRQRPSLGETTSKGRMAEMAQRLPSGRYRGKYRPSPGAT